MVLAILLIAGILMQQRGSGLGGSFGGDSSVYSTRRGAEKVIFWVTIAAAVLFFGISFLRLIL